MSSLTKIATSSVFLCSPGSLLIAYLTLLHTHFPISIKFSKASFLMMCRRNFISLPHVMYVFFMPLYLILCCLSHARSMVLSVSFCSTTFLLLQGCSSASRVFRIHCPIVVLIIHAEKKTQLVFINHNYNDRALVPYW